MLQQKMFPIVGLWDDRYLSPVLDMVTTVSLPATTVSSNFIPATAIVKRSLRDIINQAAALAQQKELLSKEEWHDLTLQYKRTFVNNMLKLWRWWQELPEKLRDRLLSIRCKYVPFNGIMQVVKIPTKCLERFLETCEEGVSEYLDPNSWSKFAQMFIPKPKKRRLSLGEVATEEHWVLVAKIFQLDRDALTRLKSLVSEQPTTDEIIQICSKEGFDISKLLSKKDREDWKSQVSQQELKEENARISQNYKLLQEENSGLLEANYRLEQQLKVLQTRLNTTNLDIAVMKTDVSKQSFFDNSNKKESKEIKKVPELSLVEKQKDNISTDLTTQQKEQSREFKEYGEEIQFNNNGILLTDEKTETQYNGDIEIPIKSSTTTSVEQPTVSNHHPIEWVNKNSKKSSQKTKNKGFGQYTKPK